MAPDLMGERAINNNNVYERNKQRLKYRIRRGLLQKGKFPDIFVKESLLEKVTFKLIPEV